MTPSPRLLTLLTAFLAFLSVHSFNPRWLGTMMPLDTAAFGTAVPWDTTRLTPVHVEYVARHGARFLSSPEKTAALRSFLLNARNEGTLTPRGEKMLALIHRIDSLSAGRWGALSPLGMAEEEFLARRLMADLPRLLHKADVKARATYVPRVVMTMYAFCHEMARHSSWLEINADEGRRFNPLLRFFETDSAYVCYLDHGPWKREYERYATRTLPAGPAASMAAGGVPDAELRRMSLAAYGILQGLPAMGLEGIDPSLWFTPAEWEACWKVSNLKHYYQRSANPYSLIPEESARPLLNRILDGLDSAFRGEPGPAANLWFGHAETVLPLFSLMGLPGCKAATCTAAQVAGEWSDAYVSPLGANLAIAGLADRNGGRWVAMRLNGRWIDWPGRGMVVPYDWIYSSMSTSKSSPKRSSLSEAGLSEP